MEQKRIASLFTREYICSSLTLSRHSCLSVSLLGRRKVSVLMFEELLAREKKSLHYHVIAITAHLPTQRSSDLPLFLLTLLPQKISVMTFEELLTRGEEAVKGEHGGKPHYHPPRPEDPATIMYTSGTTGK